MHVESPEIATESPPMMSIQHDQRLRNDLQRHFSNVLMERLTDFECDTLFSTEKQPHPNLDQTDAIADLLLSLTKNGDYQRLLSGEEESFMESFTNHSVIETEKCAEELYVLEKRAHSIYRVFKEKFPTSLWTCCSKLCFLMVAVNPDYSVFFNNIVKIHEMAQDLLGKIKITPELIQNRRRGIGTSTVAFTAPCRNEREAGLDEEDENARKNFAAFVIDVFPYIRGEREEAFELDNPPVGLCISAACAILGVSRNFLYKRKSRCNADVTEDELSSIVDVAGSRSRQHRRKRDRSGFPSIVELPNQDCGCSPSCWSGVSIMRLESEYTAFCEQAGQLRPRRKDNRYLLNVMFSPLTNSTVRTCDKALSCLYTVSEGYIADVRRTLETMCKDPSLDDRPLLEKGVEGYRKHMGHPMNRYPDYIRERVEKHLDMVLRADPAGSGEVNVCRLYSPEINTQEKLRKVLAEALQDDEDIDVQLSSSTIQRMTNDYMNSRKCRIVFDQKDHNACPNCKTFNYAVLQYHYEAKKLKEQHEKEFSGEPRPFTSRVQQRHDDSEKRIVAKVFQEDEALRQFREHNGRDSSIRKAVKTWSDHFRKVEYDYIRLSQRPDFRGESDQCPPWGVYLDRACITHQDDMTKVDLPHFTVDASCDITRWRFDVNAHVSSVTEDSVIFSHEQGSGAKNASMIIEEIILDHLIRCRGEGIKIIVSDNAAVGKNWTSTVVLPQYLVDQGLAKVVLVVFLENNHGKWLADMLFGQLQTKRKRTTLLSVDDLLSEFESIRRRNGKVHGFALNPLSSVDFVKIFDSLGYETKPPSSFAFTKRNIHFAGACAAGAKEGLSPNLKMLLGPALPSDAGMVRISSSPPSDCPQTDLPFAERYIDVPAAVVTRPTGARGSSSPHLTQSPLVVPLDAKFSSSGSGVVSQRTTKHVGYNGIEFRKASGYPELRNRTSPLVQRAWPPGLIASISGSTDEPVASSENVKCAPLNWVVRRPVQHFKGPNSEWKSRYPPQNMLNSKHGFGPRHSAPWEVERTYEEPPFPLISGTSAYFAMKNVAVKYCGDTESVDVLDLLREVFACMGNRDGVSDQWLQYRATVPHSLALEHYRSQITLFAERNEGEPTAPPSVRAVFNNDVEVLREVAQMRSQEQGRRKSKQEALAKLFEKASSTPGGLDRFLRVVERKHEEYAEKLKIFKAKQRDFDLRHGIVPEKELGD